MTYKLLTGTIETLPDRVNDYLRDGWLMFCAPFMTGRRLLIAANTPKPEYEPEIAQAIYRREKEAP